LTAVIAVPVAQVPIETQPTAEPKVAEVKVETPVAEVKVETPVVATETKTEVPAATETKVEAKVETPVAETKVETKAVAPVVVADEIKTQTLAQVMKAITDLSGSFNGEEFNMLKDVMSKGTEILAKAEEKAQEIHSHPEFQNLLQSDSLFGIKNDGTIDADVATAQLTQLMSLLTGTQMSAQEKTLVHDLIGGFSGLFAPIVSGTDSMNADLEKLAQQFTNKFDTLQTKFGENSKDKLLDTQTLLSVMTEDDGSVDTQLLSQVTQKFMDRISSQFDKVMGSVEKFSKEQ